MSGAPQGKGPRQLRNGSPLGGTPKYLAFLNHQIAVGDFYNFIA